MRREKIATMTNLRLRDDLSLVEGERQSLLFTTLSFLVSQARSKRMGGV